MSQHPDTLSCEQVVEELERFVDGDMPRAEAAAMERHLGSCDPCQSELDLAREIRDGLRLLPAFDAPEELLEEVKGTARQSTSAVGTTRWWQSRPSPVWALAAALVLAAVLTPLLTSRQTVGPTLAEAAEVERATQEVRLALAYVGQYSRRTGIEIRDGLIVERLVVPAAEGLSSLREAPGGATQGEHNNET